MQWPLDYTAEFQRRLINYNRILGDVDLQHKLDIYYASNPKDWINDWCVTFDPRKMAPNPRLMPFRMFPRQSDFIDFLHECWADKESGLTEKARDIGATWLACAFSVWLWKYHAGTVVGWGSRKEEYVDKKGDPKAIFPKIRQIIEYLPAWQRPVGYNPNLHATFMRIVNPDNDSVITGEAGDNLGRGGRTTIYFKDESAHYERPEMIEAALGDNTDVQIDISSVNGSANVFYRRRMAGEVWESGKIMTPGKTRVFIFDWRDHPGKTQEWYDAREAKARDEGLLHIFRQEVDRDYAGSQDRVIIAAEWARACIDAHIKLGFDDSGEHMAAQDVADGGGDKNALAIRYGLVLRHASHWGGEAGDAARHAIPICKEHSVGILNYDSIGVGSAYREATKQEELKSLMGNMRLVPWNAGAPVLEPERRVIPNDPESPTNEKQYLNLKAQAWFRMRSRCYKTYQAITHGKKYPIEELISFDSQITCVHELIMQLAQAKSVTAMGGKTKIDKMPDGSTSPNIADAVVMLYCPVKPPSSFFS